jgi:hypothetical protein
MTEMLPLVRTRVWIGFIWLRIQTCRKLGDEGNEPLKCILGEKFPYLLSCYLVNTKVSTSGNGIVRLGYLEVLSD